MAIMVIIVFFRCMCFAESICWRRIFGPATWILPMAHGVFSNFYQIVSGMSGQMSKSYSGRTAVFAGI